MTSERGATESEQLLFVQHLRLVICAALTKGSHNIQNKIKDSINQRPKIKNRDAKGQVAKQTRGQTKRQASRQAASQTHRRQDKKTGGQADGKTAYKQTSIHIHKQTSRQEDKHTRRHTNNQTGYGQNYLGLAGLGWI